MATKWYLRSAAASNPPTDGTKATAMPVGTDNTGTRLNNASHGGYSLSDTKGDAGDIDLDVSMLAQTTQQSAAHGRWTSPGLQAGTYGSGTWTVAFGCWEDNSVVNAQSRWIVYFWRPGTSSVVGYVRDSSGALGSEFPAGGTNDAGRTATFTGSNVTIQTDDVLVVEVWHAATMSMSTGVTARVSYDGSTDPVNGVANTDAASYIQAPADIPVNTGTTISPSPVAVPLVVPAPTIAKTLTISPSPVQVPLVVPAPTVTTPYPVTPSPVTVPLVVPAPTLTMGAITISPSPVAIPLVVPAPTVSKTLTITPSPVQVPLVVPAPTISLSLAVAPSPVAVPLVVPDPSVTVTGGGTTISPDAVAVPLVVPQPTVTLGALTISPSPVAVPLVVPQPAVTLGAITVTPSPVAVPIVVPQPTVSLSLAITPDPVPIPLVIPSPTVSAPANQTITPDPVVCLLVVPDPTVTVQGTVPPVVVVSGGGNPYATLPTHRRPDFTPPDRTLYPLPVVVDLSELRLELELALEEEELMLAGVL